MPLYDYRCAQCGKISEVRHGFNESWGEPCPVCGGALTRVFNPAPIVFKGSGFYVTDSRKAAKGTAGKTPATETKPTEKTEAKAPAAETKSGESKPSEPAA